MPIPQRIARFNRYVTNPITRRIAGRVPPLAIVEHTGRISGKTYRTPIMVFPARDGSGDMVIALTYGPDTDWVRNVLHAGRCGLQYRGRQMWLTGPRLIESDDPPDDLPGLVRWFLALIGVRFFLRLSREV